MTAAPLHLVREHLNRIVLGQGAVVDCVLITLIAGGHALLLGVPGLAKTRLVLAAAAALGLSSRRVQGTPDLMPSDILGCEVLDEGPDGRRALRFVPGPVFAQCLLVDEVNRAPPRTQAALLQAMEEGLVTAGGRDHPLPRPFHVLATQNPLEHAGTYPLPEAQRDRFLMCIAVGYPGPAAEREMLCGALDEAPQQEGSVAGPHALEEAQGLARRLPVGEGVVDGVLALVRGLRPGPDAAGFVNEGLAWGPSPRAARGLLAAARARAVLGGRSTPSVEDVAALAVPVLAHRVGPRPGADPAEVIEAACRAL